jgi:hypothetical protein
MKKRRVTRKGQKAASMLWEKLRREREVTCTTYITEWNVRCGRWREIEGKGRGVGGRRERGREGRGSGRGVKT